MSELAWQMTIRQMARRLGRGCFQGLCAGGASDNIRFDVPIRRVLSNLVAHALINLIALPRHARLELGAAPNGAIYEEVERHTGNLTEINRGG